MTTKDLDFSSQTNLATDKNEYKRMLLRSRRICFLPVSGESQESDNGIRFEFEISIDWTMGTRRNETRRRDARMMIRDQMEGLHSAEVSQNREKFYGNQK